MSLNANGSSTNTVDRWFSRGINLNWYTIVIVLILGLALFTRFYDLGSRVMSHDESLHTRYSYNLYKDGDFQHTPLMHGPVLFHMTALSYSLFGDNDFSARIYTALLGVAVVMSPLLFRRWLGKWGVILAMVMLLISPLMLYYNRYIRHDTPSIFFALIMLWSIMMYTSGPANQRRRTHWLYLLAAAMVLNLGSKETAFIYVAIFGIFVLLYFFVRFAQYRWDLPGKTIFYTLMIGILMGGVLSLGMYIIFDIIQFDLFSPTEASRFTMLTPGDQTAFLVWTFAVIAVSIGIIISTAFWAFRDQLRRIRWADVLVIVGLMFAVSFTLVVIEEFSHTAPATSEPASPSVPGEGDGNTAVLESSIRWLPMIVIWVVAIGGFIFLLLTRRRNPRGEKFKEGEEARGFWGTLDQFVEVDILVVMGALILPWATALIPYLMKGNSTDYIALAETLPDIIYNTLVNIPQIGTPEQVGQTFVHIMAWLPLMGLQIAIGLMWDWKRFVGIWLVFHGIFAFFFTTVFTNIAGLATGMIYSLGYWLEQQGVRRGSQPQYYYLLIIMPFYEFLPVIGGVVAMFGGMTFFWRWRKKQLAPIVTRRTDDAEDDEEMDAETLAALMARREQQRLRAIPFLIFVAWLAVLNLVGYSLAGEKMPWLGTHLTLPLIFLTAWFFGRIFDRIELPKFTRRGWILLILTPMFLLTLAQVLLALVVGRGPFRGLTQPELQQTYSWLASVAVTGVLVYIILRMTTSVGWRHVRHVIVVSLFGILAVVTARSAWMASFIEYDNPTEYLVYAHAAPAVKTVLEQIEELSLRTTDGKNIQLAYDNSVSWPYSWYFRDYPNARFIGSNPTMQNLSDAMVVVVGDDKRGVVDTILEDRYQRVDHMRLWWPMQEYFYLTADRLGNLFDFSPDNVQAAQLREGIFDIWWSRDYSTYGTATDKDFSLQRWPVSDTMHVYIRKDYAAQIWEYGTGEGTVENPLDEIEQNVCNTNWLTDRQPQMIIQPESPMLRPLDITVDDDGRLYVAEEGGNRISVYDETGTLADVIGMQGSEPGQFIRPNGVAIGPEGALYVADTWNYRIQQFVDGESVVQFGQAGEYGFAATTDPVDGFWGPRDVAVDNQGRIYVSDTGNKRVRVYTIDGGDWMFLYDIASGGSAPGQLDEPSGVAIHPDDGRVFVADTWNRRVSVFNADGSFLTTIPVRGWYQELGNRPYLAIDAERELLYVTDPDVGRVLVYDTDGNCRGSFGSLAGDTPLPSQFRTVGGIAVGDDGSVYVADAALGRVLKYGAGEEFLTLPEEPEETSDLAEVTAEEEMPEVTEDMAEITQESAPGE